MPTPVNLDAGHLVCPVCGDGYLRHYLIESFNRVEEDSTAGKHAVVDGQKVDVDEDISGNPSSRRDGLIVSLACEGCEGVIHRLAIVQHKGRTQVHWLDN